MQDILAVVLRTCSTGRLPVAALNEIARRQPLRGREAGSRQIRRYHRPAIAEFEDDLEELERAGVHAGFNFYAEADSGFAEHIRSTMASDIQPQED